MTDRYRQLLEERARAKFVLDVSAGWIAWKAADAALRPSIEADDLDRLSAPFPVSLIPEDVVGLTDSFDSWDEQDPLLLEYTRVRRSEELRERLMNSAEWHSFQEAQQRLLVFAKEELLKKKDALERRRSGPSRLSSHGEGAAHIPSPHPSSASSPMLQPLPAAANDSSSPSDESSPALHVPPSSTPASILGSPTSMAIDTVVATTVSSAFHSPQAEQPSFTAAESDESSSRASVSQLPFPSSSSSSSSTRPTVATSESTDSSTARDRSARRNRHSRQPSTQPPRSSPSRLIRPLWCLEMVEDGTTVLGANQLGLVDREVREICSCLRPQMQRIWSERGPRSLLAALVTAQRFTPTSWTHPTHQQMDELRQRVHDMVERWSDEHFAVVITEYKRTDYVTRFLTSSAEGPLDMSFLRVLEAVDPAYPTVYVICVNSLADPRQASLDIIGNPSGLNTKQAPCIVLYRHVSSDNHYEAVSWKPSRGGTPLTTSFTRSHELIVALEKWHSRSPSLSPTRKRKRTTREVVDLVQDEVSNGASSSHEHELGNGGPSS
jgi:hypothetical protein